MVGMESGLVDDLSSTQLLFCKSYFSVCGWKYSIQTVGNQKNVHVRFSIRMEAETLQQGKDVNLITIEESATIESFKREVLFLYSEMDQCVRLSFIVTNDVVEGNGMVVLHISPNKTSSRFHSSHPERKKPISTVSPRESIPLVSPAPVFHQSALASTMPGTKNRSILARTSRRPSLLQSASITRKVEDEISALMVGSPQIAVPMTTRSQESPASVALLSCDTVVKSTGASESDISEKSRNETPKPQLTFSIPVLPPPKNPVVDGSETDSSTAVDLLSLLPNTSIELKDISISPSSDVPSRDPLAALLDPSAPHPVPFNYASSVYSSNPGGSWRENPSDPYTGLTDHFVAHTDHQVNNLTDHSVDHHADATTDHFTDHSVDHHADASTGHLTDHSVDCPLSQTLTTPDKHQKGANDFNFIPFQHTNDCSFTSSDSDSVFTHQEESPTSDGWFFQRVPMEQLSSNSLNSENNLIQKFSSLSSGPAVETESISEVSASVTYCQYFGCHRLIYDTSKNAENRRCQNCGFVFCDEVGLCSFSHS